MRTWCLDPSVFGGDLLIDLFGCLPVRFALGRHAYLPAMAPCYTPAPAPAPGSANAGFPRLRGPHQRLTQGGTGELRRQDIDLPRLRNRIHFHVRGAGVLS